ncbi:nitroreductase family deazaflavin-dependent oxidoreductase [Nocardia puris]|uniref:Deazaflavin-dependent oxidoreductase (Nitroreductase family) n=1 Tax=Nocardia puris TaxID=208602 RepID=A0A366DV17_9NOCA|nr:nitroreductase family deazaflavin-dependent oxidoreductase [Nocardia puris]MBF6210509.1 nitroreductase family deazaflavin-dependent oxidoreductase [Nocardia puris]MBF6369234.1 nitroreductase family deazaflavin-dependent oxidoreductase [Nocardia puris]MBF6457769.1 nitroreductase family deazaflavin-dependent oxidoreductase [Nocardia puris]RBO93936.1 deazaflavin-dependent oxidoreductase (nitroreductase family) [Nocardia puris]
MWIWIAIGAGVPIASALLGGLILVLVLRTGYAPGVAAVRRFHRRFTNRQVLKTAGQPGASAAVIRHTGRSSGKLYETPIGVAEAGADFIVALPYGPRTDWLANLLAAGSAEVVHEGDTYRVSEPELVTTASVSRYQSAGERLTLRLFGVDEVLRVRKEQIGESA